MCQYLQHPRAASTADPLPPLTVPSVAEVWGSLINENLTPATASHEQASYPISATDGFWDGQLLPTDHKLQKFPGYVQCLVHC